MEKDNNNWVVKTYSTIKNSLTNFFGATEFKENKSIVGELVNILTIGSVLFAPIGFGFWLIGRVYHETPRQVQLYLVIGNLIAVTLWFVLFRFRKFKFHELKFIDDKNKAEYRKFFKVKDTESVDDKNERVNKLVGQLKLWITGYVVCLMIVYGAFLFDNECLRKACDSLSEIELSSGRQHYYLKIFQDVFNLISAACLYLGFKVLYNQTLDKKNKPNIYFFDATFVSLIIIVLYLAYMHSVIYAPQNNNLPYDTIIKIGNIRDDYVNKVNNTAPKSVVDVLNAGLDAKRLPADSIKEIKQITDKYEKDVNLMAATEMKDVIRAYESSTNDKWANIFGLIIGSFNGLAMSLLFGRYISMEHMINNVKDRTFYDWFSTFTVFLLPIYALAQPLFGAFEINAFGDSRAFANYVFFICLFGKIFFLYFTFDFIRKRKLHYYLHLIINSHDILKNVNDYFEDDLKE
ncbi:MAG TPA: hypothetical protein VF721_13245 [Pyrinomonadaceae bacterium]